MPSVTWADVNKYNKSRINIEDQWASHPTNEERVTALQKLNIVKDSSENQPAISLFPNAEKVEEELTKQVFYYMAFKPDVVTMNYADFCNEISSDVVNNRFPDEYNEYYDNKNPMPFDVDSITDFDNSGSMETLFGRDKVDMVYKYLWMDSDKNVLNGISNKTINVKTFDYDGQKYKRKDAVNLISVIDKEMRESLKQIEQNDIDIYRFFYSLAKEKGVQDKLKSLYQDLFDEDKHNDCRQAIFNKFVDLSNALRNASDDKQVESLFKEMSHHEVDLRKEIRAFIENPAYDGEITKDARANFDKYLSRDWSYSKNNISDQEYLETLFTSLNDFNNLNSRGYFIAKVNLLNYQVALLNS